MAQLFRTVFESCIGGFIRVSRQVAINNRKKGDTSLSLAFKDAASFTTKDITQLNHQHSWYEPQRKAPTAEGLTVALDPVKDYADPTWPIICEAKADAFFYRDFYFDPAHPFDLDSFISPLAEAAGNKFRASLPHVTQFPRTDDFCEWCGPICYGGASHNARQEAGDKYGSLPGESVAADLQCLAHASHSLVINEQKG